MRLLFVTPELTPYSGLTPTGDTCAALPKALRGRDHEVAVVSPLYGFVEPSRHGLGRRLRKIEAEVAGRTVPFALYDAKTAAGVDVLFLAEEELFGGCEEVPVLDDDEANARRYHAFAQAVVDLARQDDDGFDVIQCHDWASALVPTLAKRSGLELPSVLAIADASRTGRFGSDVEKELGLEHGFLEAGVRDATKITTVSPSYAETITEGGFALGPGLAARGRDFTGIVGGIDTALWNPATDAHLESRFDPMDLSGKRRCKAAEQRAAGFPVRDDVPLLVVLGELTASSGLDVFARIVARVMRNDVQVRVVAEGDVDPELVGVLEEHAERWPDRLAVEADDDREAIHRALSAADLVFVEPRQAPGGTTQLRAQRYGALPIGPRKGALADTVVDCDAQLKTGSGFLYDGRDEDEVLACVQRSIAAFENRRDFERLRYGVLGGDHGWDRAAYLYERLYDSIT